MGYETNTLGTNNILILGAGFAGLEAAIFLKKAGYAVTLVNERDYFYIYPTSIWVPTHESSFEDVCIDLKLLQKAHQFELIIDSVESIRAKGSQVLLKSGKIINDYHSLIIAMGASKMEHSGIENTLSICGTPETSLLIRDKIDALIAKGSGKICFGFGGNPKDSSAVRGGPAFELLFNVDTYLRKKKIRDNYELTFFAPMPQPGKRMGEKALKMMDKHFKRLNIKQHFGKKIKSFEKDSIIFEDGSRLASDFTMFIAAGDGHEVVKRSDLPTNEAGFIKTDDFCNVIFDDDAMPRNIYAIGDIASLEGASWRAKQGHVAEVMARNVAHNIAQKDKRSNELKGYSEHLNILCIMDSGNGASFIYRDDSRAFMLPMPIVGHWMKKAWGHYCRYSKLGKIPRLPGL